MTDRDREWLAQVLTAFATRVERKLDRLIELQKYNNQLVEGSEPSMFNPLIAAIRGDKQRP